MRVSGSTGTWGQQWRILAGRSPGSGGWQGRGEESASLAGLGQAAAARGAGGWGIPALSSGARPDKPLTWGRFRRENDHQAEQCCISIISSPVMWVGGQERKLRSGEGIARSQRGLWGPTPGFFLLRWLHSSGPETQGKGLWSLAV